MDKEILVTSGIRAGHRLLDQLARESFAVSAAAWLRMIDDGQWYLHIVTPETRRRGVHEAHLALIFVLRALPPVETYPGGPDAGFGPSDVRLLSEDEHLGKCITDIYTRYPGMTNTFVHGGRFDPYEFDSLVYLYAVPHPAPAPAN